MYQEKYWKELYQLKVHVNYIELYHQWAEWWDKAINIFIALTSSGSIAGWAIWQQASMIWAMIIATSQVITVVKSFLPYQPRQKALIGLLYELDDLLVYTEKRWYDVAEGKLAEQEINDLQFEIRKKKSSSIKKFLGNISLPEKNKLLTQAQKSADIYFDNFYPQEESHDREKSE